MTERKVYDCDGGRGGKNPCEQKGLARSEVVMIQKYSLCNFCIHAVLEDLTSSEFLSEFFTSMVQIDCTGSSHGSK